MARILALFGLLLLSFPAPSFGDEPWRTEERLGAVRYVISPDGNARVEISSENGWGFCLLHPNALRIIIGAETNSFVIDAEEGVTLRFRSPAEMRRIIQVNDDLASAPFHSGGGFIYTSEMMF